MSERREFGASAQNFEMKGLPQLWIFALIFPAKGSCWNRFFISSSMLYFTKSSIGESRPKSSGAPAGWCTKGICNKLFIVGMNLLTANVLSRADEQTFEPQNDYVLKSLLCNDDDYQREVTDKDLETTSRVETLIEDK